MLTVNGDGDWSSGSWQMGSWTALGAAGGWAGGVVPGRGGCGWRKGRMRLWSRAGHGAGSAGRRMCCCPPGVYRGELMRAR